MNETLARDIARINRRELGKHWQELVWDGHGAWAGDPHINLMENILTDEIEAWYMLPNQEPQLILRRHVDDFDIDLFCQALHRADNRNISVKDKIAEVDASNAAIERAAQKAADERTEEAVGRLAHAIVRDTDPGAPKQHLITKGASWTPAQSSTSKG